MAFQSMGRSLGESRSRQLQDVSIILCSQDIPSSFVAALNSEDSVSIDIETSGLSFREETIGAIQVYAPRVGVYVVRPPYRASNLKDLIGREDIRKIFHHALFDLRFLRYHLEIKPKNIACTKIASKITHPEWEKHSLSSLVQEYLNTTIDKSQQRSDWLREDLTIDQVSYAVTDVLYLEPLLNGIMRSAVKAHRQYLIKQSFNYIPIRVELDLIGSGDVFGY